MTHAAPNSDDVIDSHDTEADFTKIIYLGTTKHTRGARTLLAGVFCEIKYEAGRLSITGVEGPLANGNAIAAAAVRSIFDMSLGTGSTIAPGPGWTAETIARFLATWGRWHLNDMRAECSHQTALGWHDLAQVEAILYHWRITLTADMAKKEAEKSAREALKAGRAFTPTAEQTRAALLPYAVVTHTPASPSPDYEPKRPLWAGDRGHEEKKTLGWLRPSEHPDGLLCRPCPTCGYERGSKWLREDVPADVLAWLRGLPASASRPPWV